MTTTVDGGGDFAREHGVVETAAVAGANSGGEEEEGERALVGLGGF
jgi:hypothetical protein